MDRQTLSHYGWIIISVIVISVIIALATPIGELVADSVIGIATKSNDIAKSTTGEGYEENVKYYQDMMKKEGSYIDPGLYEASATTDDAFQKMTKDWTSLTTVASNGPRVISNRSGVLTTNFSYTSYAENISSQILKGDLVVSNDIGTIGEKGFALCSRLNGVYFKSLNYIGELSFAGCSSLKWIAFESPTLKGITKNAFVDCTDLTTIYYNGTMRQFSQASIDKNQGITKTIYVVCNDGKMVLNFTGSETIDAIFPTKQLFIPTGAKYTIKASNTVLEGNGTNKFPDAPATGDTYEEGDYKYTYNKGSNYGTKWSVLALDKTKTSYGQIVSKIAGEPVTNMFYTFASCSFLTTVPTIPNSVISMESTFYACMSLTTVPKIPNSVTSMSYTFEECQSLTTAPEIPDSVTKMNGTFLDCKSLTTAPKIPNSVTSMEDTFGLCTSLTTAPTIPNGVTNMRQTFASCTSLTGTITINANPTNYNSCFAYTVKPITLTGTSAKLAELATTATNGNVTVQ